MLKFAEEVAHENIKQHVKMSKGIVMSTACVCARALPWTFFSHMFVFGHG